MTISSATLNTGEIKVWPRNTFQFSIFCLFACFDANLLFLLSVRINPLSLMEIILYVARQMTGKNNMKQQGVILSRRQFRRIYLSIYKKVFCF